MWIFITLKRLSNRYECSYHWAWVWARWMTDNIGVHNWKARVSLTILHRNKTIVLRLNEAQHTEVVPNNIRSIRK